MILPGLVSITYRQLSVSQVIARSNAAGVAGIEWGGDIHVPHGDLPTAKLVGQQTRDAGLQISAYGSYYRAGHDADLSAETVVASAQSLGAPVIRIWTGQQDSADATNDYRDQVTRDCRKIATLAADAGIKIALEWHRKTLTDTAAAATDLFAAVDHPNLYAFWQPRVKFSAPQNLTDMQAALPHLLGLHVFNWDEHTADRLALADGEAAWAQYLDRVPADFEGFASLEFVPNDDPELLSRETATLQSWLAARS
jgi:3-dehydroshikimate dehydratase